jgi:hypothetical protein
MLVKKGVNTSIDALMETGLGFLLPIVNIMVVF